MANRSNHRKRWFQRWYFCLLAVLFTLGFILFAHPVYAQDVSFRFSVEATGTAPFDANSAPGNDANGSNTIVRTQDVIVYRWDYTLNNGNLQNAKLIATLPPQLEVSSIPAACFSSSTVSTDASSQTQTLTCNIGTIQSGSSGFITFSARVLGRDRLNNYVLQNQVITARGALQADGLTAIAETAPNTTISTTPKVDLRKDSAVVVGVYKGQDGTTDGLVVRYPITAVIAAGTGKGSEALVGTLTFTDTLLDRSTNSPVPGARLYTWEGRAACGWLGQDSLNTYSSHPYGKRNNTYPDDQSTSDSGTWTCSQSSPGSPITIQISGADLSGNSFPTRTYVGSTIAANTNYLISGTIHLWVPLSSITSSSTGQLDVRNILSPLTTPSASGQPNQEPNTTNNYHDHTLVGVGGSMTSYYHSNVNSRNAVLPGMSAIYGGDGVVVPSQVFSARFTMKNTGVVPWQEAIFCSTIDNRTQQVTPLTNNPASAVVNYSSSGFTGYVIEYGTGTYPDYAAQRRATCRDVDSPDGWYADIRLVPGGSAAVSKVRWRAVSPVPIGFSLDYTVNLTARSIDYLTNTPIAVGTQLTETLSFYLKDYRWRQGTTGMAALWSGGYYQADTHQSVGWGDRVTLTRAIVRIDKQNVPNQPTISARIKEKVSFVLKPTLTVPIAVPPGFLPSVMVKDILPAGLTYVLGSANLLPAQIINNPDRTTTISWNLGNLVPNQTLPVISFEALVDFDARNNATLVNQAIVESPDDVSVESARRDTAAVLVGNSAIFGIYKSVVKLLIEPNESVIYTLSYANLGGSDISTSTFIDILPYLNNGLNPNSTFHGTLTFNAITGTNGESFEYTKALPTTIVGDPSHPSNQVGGSTVWCSSYTAGGNCPSSKAEVTGVRVNALAFPQGSPTRHLKLVIDTANNQPTDTYTNQFFGQVNGLIGSLISNDVSSRVRLPGKLLLVERITAINQQRYTNLVDDPTAEDNHPKWPANFLQGLVDGNRVVPGDEVEYTVYFLSTGDTNLEKVTLCNLIPAHSTLQPRAFNAVLTGTDPDRGMALQLGNTQQSFSNQDDSDAGRYLAPGTPLPPQCNNSKPNTHGAVRIQVGQLSHSGPGGTPSFSYGWIRFKVKV